ncbi:MAG: hypothetical protein ABI680_06120 [Chthoniobacteraceae bacterium]
MELLEPRIAPAAISSLNLADVSGSNGFMLSDGANHSGGHSVSDAGDINGDGYDDFSIGAPTTFSSAGAVYVVFGQPKSFASRIDLLALDGSNGFKITGSGDFDLFGKAVGAAGDVNGDGFDDLIISAPYAGESGARTGAVYVVFGKAAQFDATLSVSSLDGGNGFKIGGGPQPGLNFGSAAGAGDVNGDGFDDIIFGASRPDRSNGPAVAGYVLFGKGGGFAANLDLNTLDQRVGFRLVGGAYDQFLYSPVAGAGDLNGDGFDDVMVTAPSVGNGDGSSGATFVIFGNSGGFAADVALSSVDGSNGFSVSGALKDSAASGIGDINHDGFDDLIVGTSDGTAVIFGKGSDFAPIFRTSEIDGSNGFEIRGGFRAVSASAAGDVNGDGLADLIVAGVPPNSPGTSFVVFGKTGGFDPILDLSALDGLNGFTIRGSRLGDSVGCAVSSAGDVNGDGFDDLLIDFPERDSSVLVFGFGSGPAPVHVFPDGKTAVFTDWDGDRVSIEVTRGTLNAADFKFADHNPVTGGSRLVFADFTDPSFHRTNILITATPGALGGDDLVTIGSLNARGLPLGKVSIDGQLSQIDARSLKGLTVESLARMATDDRLIGPRQSEIAGKLGVLTVHTDVAQVGVFAKNIGRIEIAGPLDGATIQAKHSLKKLTIGGNVSESRILAGYDPSGQPRPISAFIGNVRVAGDWIASDLASGVAPGDAFFGNAGDSLAAPGLLSRIAKITVAGAVVGSDEKSDDRFGFVAREIGKFTLGADKLPLVHSGGPDRFDLGTTGDVQIREAR